MRKIWVSLALLLYTVSLQAQQRIYVSLEGDDMNAGTISAPLASLEGARDKIRELRTTSDLPTGGIEVIIRAGIYERTTSFELGAQDKGTENSPIIYKASPGEEVVFLSGKKIETSSWQPLSAESIERIHPNIAAGQLYELDYGALDIQNGEFLNASSQSTGGPTTFSLFVNGERQTLSQWPNLNENVTGYNDPGWATPNGTRDNYSFYFGEGGQPSNKDVTNELDLDGTNRSKRWKDRMEAGHNLWLRGHWRTPWSPRLSMVEEINVEESWIKLTDIPTGGMGSKYTETFTSYDGNVYRTGSGAEKFYALNMLEEIDQPGEYAINFKDKRVYFFPPDELTNLEILVMDNSSSMVDLDSADFVQFQDLSFKGGLGSGIVANDCNHLVVSGCVIDGVGGTGIVVKGGIHQVIECTDIFMTGSTGLVITHVGDRPTLTSGEMLVTNNHIHHVGNRVLGSAGISTNTVVGITFSHNLIHHTPSAGISHFNDNNCIYEYNEIHNCALKTSDTGATYGTLRWDSYGNIFRYNFIHHNRRANGFYCDDGNSGDFHYKNILHNCIDALKFGGGHDNIAEQNLLIQNSQQRIDDRGISRNYRLGTRHETNLQAMKPFEEPWLSYGAQLVSDHNLTTNLWSDVLNADWKPEYPNGCRYKDNVTVESDKWKIPANGEIIFEGNEEVGSIEAAGFYDFEGMDLRTDNAIILSKFPELNEVFPKMGLIANSCRPEVPKRITDNDGAATTDGEDELIDRTLIADLDKTEYKYDFGPAESITPEGWTLIRPDMIGSVYWSGEEVEGEDQEAGAAIDDLKRDFIKGNGTSQLNLKTRNGIWKVELVMGEMNVGLVGMRVKAEGEYIGYNVQTEPGEFKFLDGAAGSLIPSAVEVKVTDGELTLEIDADSPSHWTINHLRLVRVATETEVDLEARTYQYDFGAIDSETEEGWSVISPLDYGDINWTGGALSASDDVTATEISTLTRDLVQSSEEVSFNHKISNGIWRVELVMGEQGTNHWGMQVEAEGKLIAGNISTAAREFKYIEEGGASVEPTYFDIPVTDGELNISFNVLASRPWVANFLKLTKVADDVTVDMTKLKYQYDFGSFDSETLGGWQIITQDDFGDINWTGATLTPRDQGLEEGNTNLTRDYLEATGEVNFNHKIDNGKWRIELVMGNQNMDMTGIAISVEGEQLVSDMSVGAGEYKYADSEGGSLAPAYLEVIIQDGELNISINSASTWAINHLSLTKSGSEVKLPENISCYQYDFGPVGSKTEAGWRVISLGDYGDIFWSGQELASQDQGLGQGIDELTRDFVTSGGAVEFHHKISNGKWRVQLVMGEKNTNHWGMRVEAEGERIAWNFATDKGEFKYVGQGEASAEPAFFDVEVADEELNLVLSVGGSRPWVANHIKLIKLTTDEEGNDVPLTSEDTNCGCNGIFLDADEDGVCDSSDKCPLIDDALLGTACDDGDSCTVNDTYNVDCNCVGTILDEDKDGICAAEDCNDQDETIGRKQEAGTACDDGNPTTVNDVIQVDGCTCIGSQPKSLGVRMCLEGPYDPEIGLMSDSLRQKNLLPLEDPYGLGEFTNPALLENTGSDAIVDWVKVELRDKLDPSVIHATEAMLLQRDGNLITAEGDSLLTIGLSLDSVYLTVSHANHLSLTTETPVHLRDTLKLDFSLLETAIYGGKDAGKIVGDTRLLIAGDANGDGTVDEIDKIQLWRTQNGTSVSESSKAADFNLDGVINVVDRNEYLRVNNGAVERKP